MTPEPQLGFQAFPQPDNPGELVWRYMDLPKFMAMLFGQSLHLSRVDRLPDKFEGTLSRPTKDAMFALFKSVTYADGRPSTQDLAEAQYRSFAAVTNRQRNCTYVNCWRLGDVESDAMWRLYCGAEDGLAIVLPYERLRNSVESVSELGARVGLVTYIDYEAEPIPPHFLTNASIRKRVQFEHEREVRIVCSRLQAAVANAELPLSVSVPWLPEAHIERVVISPYAKPWYGKVVQEAVRRVTPGLLDRVQLSSMGSRPYS